MAEASIHRRIDAERGAFDEPNKEIPTYRRYIRGDQDDTLTPRQKAALEGCERHRRSVNICGPIVTESADRVVYKEIRAGELDKPTPGQEELQRFCNEIAIKNAVLDLLNDSFLRARRDGNHAIRAAYRGAAGTGRVVFILEEWWDGASGMFVSDPNLDAEPYAVKQWDERTEAYNDAAPTRTRRTIWFDNRIQEWQRDYNAGDWDFVSEVPWTRNGAMDGLPLHIPVVHFSNAGDKMMGHCGLSELYGGGLAAQDDLNDLEANKIIAARLTAVPMLKVKGYSARRRVNPVTGEPTGGPPDPARGEVAVYGPRGEELIVIIPKYTVGPGNVFSDASPDFDADQIKPGDLSQILAAKKDTRDSAFQAARVPVYAITGEWPSGDALEAAQRPIANKAERFIAKNAPRVATLFHRATEQENVFNKRGLREDVLLTAVLENVGRTDPEYRAKVRKTEAEADTAEAQAEAAKAGRVPVGAQ